MYVILFWVEGHDVVVGLLGETVFGEQFGCVHSVADFYGRVCRALQSVCEEDGYGIAVLGELGDFGLYVVLDAHRFLVRSFQWSVFSR